MDEELKAKIKEAVAELGVDKPVMSTRVAGDRIELFLYGGDHVYYWFEREGPPQPVGPIYAKMTLDELRKLASARDIRGRSKMNKDQLAAALVAAEDERLSADVSDP